MTARRMIMPSDEVAKKIRELAEIPEGVIECTITIKRNMPLIVDCKYMPLRDWPESEPARDPSDGVIIPQPSPGVGRA
jgi:hypothetical protein